MAGIKISALPASAAATFDDTFPVVQAGVTLKETLQQALNLFVTQFAGNPNTNVAGVVGQFCLDTTDNMVWVCIVQGIAAVAQWVPVMGSLTDGQLYIGDTNNAPAKSPLTAGTNISIVNTAGSIQISATGSGGFTWTDVAASPQAMAVNNGYIADTAGLLTFTLPLASSVGDEIQLIGKGAGGWIITQAANQQIIVGSVSSTVGVGGSVASTNRRDAIYIVCTTANLVWTVATGPQGILTIV